MNPSCADIRMARDTMSCSCSDENVHCAACSVRAFQLTIGTSKLSAGGGSSVGALTMSLTAGVEARLDALAMSPGLTWTDCSRCSGDLALGLMYAACSESWERLGMLGDWGREPPSWDVGEFLPE